MVSSMIRQLTCFCGPLAFRNCSRGSPSALLHLPNLPSVVRPREVGLARFGRQRYLTTMTSSKPEKATRLSPDDPNSFSRPDLARVEDIFVSLNVNFDQKIVEGHVVLSVLKKDSTVSEVVLDAKHLNIVKALDEKTGKELNFVLGHEGHVGSKLQVRLPEVEDLRVKVKIFYATTDKCSALQWLDPMQTAGKRHPYLFSQNQAIHCRSMMPCQDTPGVKAPYRAEIFAPSELTVLMSAIKEGEPEPSGTDGRRSVHRFCQKVPIQSYLIAIAVGRMESRQIGPRSRVWSEAEFVDVAASEFSETEVMLKTAEDLCGPYIWGIYDILVLPPSFPFGGMENPCLTFVTPTLLAGDKSLAGVVAHEIAHSWTGNLVTNKNFEHFWLNEGFTVFTERKIVGRMKGEALRHLEASIGWKGLHECIKVLGDENPLTALVVDLTGVDPDDAFSTVPYEKGFTFLCYLEELVGGPGEFEPFLRKYYEEFKYKSIDSYQFKEFFLEHFKANGKVSSIEWDRWFKEPGMPFYKPKLDDSLAKACIELKDEWLAWVETSQKCPFPSGDSFGGLLTEQKIEFLSLLMLDSHQGLSVAKLRKMDELYSLNAVNNAEIRFLWIRLGLRARWEEAVDKALRMVTEIGRMKFVRPLYRDLYAWEDKRQLAIDTFRKNKPTMMQVAIQGVEHDLKLAQ